MESKLLCGFLFSLHVRGLLLVFCLVSKGVNVLTSPVWLLGRQRDDNNRKDYFLLKKLKGSSTRKNRALTKPLSSSYSWLRHGYLLLNIFIEFSLNPIREFWSKRKNEHTLIYEMRNSDFPFGINLPTTSSSRNAAWSNNFEFYLDKLGMTKVHWLCARLVFRVIRNS